MTKTTGTPDARAEAWTAVQKQYLDAWVSLASQMASAEHGPQGASTATNVSPAQQLAFWTKMMAPVLPAESRGLSEKLAELGQSYLQIGEALWSVVQGVQAATNGGANWQEALREQLQELQQKFTASAGTVDPTAGLATLWGTPLQHWRRLASSFSVLPGELEKSLRGDCPLGTEALQRELRDALSVPAVGYLREWQTLAQEWGRYSLEHAKATQAYETTLVKVGTRAFELLTTRLLAMAEDGNLVESVRAAYDLWIDCAEEAYADVASGDEFPRIQARLTNTLMALKRHEQQMVEELQTALNVPTRREVNTTHSRVQELRRELRELQRQVENFDLAELHEKLDTLRSDLRALQTMISAPDPVRSGARATPTVRRKVKRRKPATARKKTED